MSSFVVEGVFMITDRGPVITRSDEPACAARDRGELFNLGDVIVCGEHTATIVGIERFAVPNAPQQGLLLRGVSIESLAEGQEWVSG